MFGAHLKELLRFTTKWPGSICQKMLQEQQNFFTCVHWLLVNLRQLQMFCILHFIPILSLAGNHDKNTECDYDSNLLYELHRKSVAEAFWNAECEAELREANNINYKFSGGTREHLMAEIDQKRASLTYPHSDCSEECRKRGKYWSLIM